MKTRLAVRMRGELTRHATFWVYMVRCSDDTYYTGYTNDVPGRLRLHNSGHGAKYVRGKGPVTMVYVKAYQYYKRAVQAECAMKKLTRKEKEGLIRTDRARAIRQRTLADQSPRGTDGAGTYV